MKDPQSNPLAPTPEASADLAVAAGRLFSSALRVARASGLRGAQAVRCANDFTVRKLGVDWCEELGISDEVEELAPRGEAPTITGLLSSNVGRFLEQLHAGRLSPLRPAPGLTKEWYAAYGSWCESEGEEPVSIKRFVHEAGRDHGLPRKVKRYVEGGAKRQGRVFLFGHCAPQSKQETEWLTSELEATRQMFAAAGVNLH